MLMTRKAEAHVSAASSTDSGAVRLGSGCSFASFGELVQGRRADGRDFLVTLPVDLWTRCRLRAHHTPGAASTVVCDMSKSRAVAELIMASSAGFAGWSVELAFDRQIPIGKGLASSTADMLAVVRAFQDAFAFELSSSAVSALFARVEPHDGLHFNSSVVYDHRRGRLLRSLDHIPAFALVGIDAGGQLSTLDYNARLAFSRRERVEYDRLLVECVDAFGRLDDRAIAHCAHRAAELHLRRSPSAFLAGALELVDAVGAWGLLVAHSGTCVALLFPAAVDDTVLTRAERAASHLGAIIRTRTLTMAELPIRLGRALS